jgi:hypothetical protein
MPHSRRDSLTSDWVRLTEPQPEADPIASGGKESRSLTGRMGIKQLMKMIGDNAPDAVKVGRYHLPKCEGTRGSRGVGILGNNLGWVKVQNEAKRVPPSAPRWGDARRRRPRGMPAPPENTWPSAWFQPPPTAAPRWERKQR